MLAKAVATEGGASFLSVDASSVENKWLGESEKNAKAVFTLARRLAPCVVFIDEVVSLLSSREGTSDDSAHGTLTSVKTTMMSEWDGLNSELRERLRAEGLFLSLPTFHGARWLRAVLLNPFTGDEQIGHVFASIDAFLAEWTS